MFDITKIAGFVKRQITRIDLFIIAGLVLLFLATRIVNLDKFPIFCDEGIYINWAKVAWRDASWRFISLTDGRQPLQTWATIPFLKIFPDDALFAGRLFSVFSGLFALSGIFALSFYMLGKRTAFWVSFLYIITPYFLIYDRMALADSLVNGFAMWIMLFSIILAKSIRLDIALLFGLIAGVGLLTKSSMRLFFVLAFFSIIYILFEDLRADKGKIKNIIRQFKDNLLHKREEKFVKSLNFVILYFISFGISLALYNIQRLSPFFHNIAEKNKTFALTFQEFISEPLRYFSNNITKIPVYIFSEMGYVVGFIGLAGIAIMITDKKQRLNAFYILIWLGISYFILACFARVVHPRYLLPFGSLLIIPAGYLIFRAKQTKAKLFILLIIFLSIIRFNYALIFDPLNTPFPPVDRGQYLEGWPAGIGIKEIVDFAREKSADKPVVLIAEGNFGMSGDVLSVYVRPGDNIEIKPYWPLDLQHLQENIQLLKDKYVYIVFSHRREFPLHWPIRLIERFDKPGDESEIYLYELTSQD